MRQRMTGSTTIPIASAWRKKPNDLRLLAAPAGASDECNRHAKRNVLTFSTHAAPSFQVGSVPQQTLDDERRQHCLISGVVNNGHHHIASLSYAMKGTLIGMTSLQKGKKTRSPSNGQQMTKRIRELDIKNHASMSFHKPREHRRVELRCARAWKISSAR